MPVKRIGRRLLILLVMIGLTAATAFWAFRNIGRWLVVPSALQSGRAIALLSGPVGIGLTLPLGVEP